MAAFNSAPRSAVPGRERNREKRALLGRKIAPRACARHDYTLLIGLRDKADIPIFKRDTADRTLAPWGLLGVFETGYRSNF
jgi:hypothetical protein